MLLELRIGNLANIELVRQLIAQILVARFAERIGDQATNIAEEIIYLVEGRIARHTPEVPGKIQQQDQ